MTPTTRYALNQQHAMHSIKNTPCTQSETRHALYNDTLFYNTFYRFYNTFHVTPLTTRLTLNQQHAMPSTTRDGAGVDDPQGPRVRGDGCVLLPDRARVRQRLVRPHRQGLPAPRRAVKGGVPHEAHAARLLRQLQRGRQVKHGLLRKIDPCYHTSLTLWRK